MVNLSGSYCLKWSVVFFSRSRLNGLNTSNQYNDLERCKALFSISANSRRHFQGYLGLLVFSIQQTLLIIIHTSSKADLSVQLTNLNILQSQSWGVERTEKVDEWRWNILFSTPSFSYSSFSNLYMERIPRSNTSGLSVAPVYSIAWRRSGLSD